MNTVLTIVMYHYVRDLRRSRFPGIKGLELELFRGQLGYFQNHYRFTTIEEVLHAIRSGDQLDGNPVLLTFDDGYADHYTNVLPLLDELGVHGAFFPPARPILDGVVLDVNKIHFILASAPIEKILRELFRNLDALRGQGHSIPSEKELLNSEIDSCRYDTREVVLVKRLLQRDLAEPVRACVTDRLFRTFVTQDEAAFAAELYMSTNQLRCMARLGMHIGGHGATHCWLNSVSKAEQIHEIEASIKFLQLVGRSASDWVMCYPYGAYNDSLLHILRSRGCALGLTTRVDLAQLTRANALTLERLDTNDLPKRSNAPAGKWTLKAQGHCT